MPPLAPDVEVAAHPSGVTAFAVFDGHGGETASEICNAQLLDSFRGVLTGLSAASVASALRSAFAAAEEQLFAARRACNTCGTTGVVVAITPDDIVTAFVGDSRAVLATGGQAVALSTDHKPMSEAARIRAAGGSVTPDSIHDCARVWGPARTFGLAMSRALGDFELKSRGASKADLLLPTPDVTVQQRSRADEFIVVATDGVWDVLSNAEAADCVREALAVTSVTYTGPPPDTGSLAHALCRRALQKGSGDNITALVVLLDGSSPEISTGDGGGVGGLSVLERLRSLL